MTLIETQSTAIARRLVPRLWVFVWIGLGLLIPGLLIPSKTISLGFTVSATTFFTIALIVSGVHRKFLASTDHFHESLDVFVHNDSAPTFFVNDDGEITYINHAALDRFGEVENKSLVLVLAAYSANPVNVIFRLQNKARQAKSAREDIVSDNGHLRLSAHFIGPQGFVWRLEDLVEYPENNAAGGEAIGLPMLLCNAEGKILHMNPASRELLGWQINHLDRVFEEPEELMNGVHTIATKNGSQTVNVLEYSRKTGRREVFLLPCSKDDGVGPFDGHLFDDLPVALLKLGKDGNVLSTNKLARKLLGKPLGGQDKLGDLVRGLGRPVADWLRDAVAGRSLAKPEVVQTSDKGSDVFLQIALSRVVEAGETRLIAVLNDATELKTLEAQFVQSQKMQAIGQLAGGVAHDFNNLLTAISGYCDLLLLRHDEGDPDYGDLIQINQNANRAASLVNQLLAFSRKQNLHPQVLELPDVISELSHLLNRLLGEKITLNVQHGSDLPRVRADKRQLEQVLMNLVVNARDAMGDTGEVLLETGFLNLTEDLHRDRATVAPGRYLSIRVSDTGVGIAKERLNKVFEPFYTTKKTGEGTGLGLSMVYGIVKQTGGFIFVDSVAGQGAEFQILFPAYEPEIITEAQTGTIEVKPVSTHKAPIKDEGIILLVEDEAPVRAFAARALTVRGYTVLEASDAEEALTMLEHDDLEVDVFVTDVIMPGKDGPTWVREAQKTRPDVKVVFVSGYAEESFADQQAKITNSVFLPKPFSLNELTEKVRTQIAA